MDTALNLAFRAADRELSVELARGPEQVREAKRLRYRVYCEERGFEAGEGGLEQDEFDRNARHVLVRSRSTGQVHGTARLIPFGADRWVPMRRVCAERVLAPLPISGSAEISRFAVSRDRSELTRESAALIRLYLIQGAIECSNALELTHLCALMEPTLLRLLRGSSIHFRPIGPLVEHHGLRQPAIFPIVEGLDRTRQENVALWSFLTRDGASCPRAAASARERAAEFV